MKTVCLIISLFVMTSAVAQERVWKSGIELGTGLSFTGYNANLAYTGSFGKNMIFLGPKIVYSDANALFDTPWGIHAGYRRLFKITSKFRAFAALEYQAVFFEYNELEADRLNSIQEFHFSYGLEYSFNKHWSVGNSIGGGGYVERLIDPFDGQVAVISGYSTQVRVFSRYSF